MKLMANAWVGDTGASTHMCNNDTGMLDYKMINEEIKIGNGRTIKAIKIGKMKVCIKQTDGRRTIVTLTSVKYVPELWCNLFSITAALEKGFDLGNVGKVITLSHGNVKIGFDQVFSTQSGFIMAAEMIQLPPDESNAVLETGREVKLMTYHRMFSHPGETVLRNTAHAYGLKLKLNNEKCEDCATSKARQSNVSKAPVERESVIGKKLMIDISLVKTISYGGAKFWLLIMDDATGRIWSYFLKKKSEILS